MDLFIESSFMYCECILSVQVDPTEVEYTVPVVFVLCPNSRAMQDLRLLIKWILLDQNIPDKYSVSSNAGLCFTDPSTNVHFDQSSRRH